MFYRTVTTYRNDNINGLAFWFTPMYRKCSLKPRNSIN